MNRKTVGAIASDLAQRPLETRSAIELEREMQREYWESLLEEIRQGKKKYDDDFYIVVITKNEKLMPNVFRNYYFTRKTCPTPDYDQAVYRYYYHEDNLGFLWIIPGRDACHHLKDNASIVDDSERELLKCVLEFADGSLYRMAKKMNGEEEDSNLLKDS